MDGLWSLVSASMIHRLMNAVRERASDINATAAAAAHDRAGTSLGIGAAAPPPSSPGPVAVAPPSHFQQWWMQQQQQQHHHPPQHHHHNSSMFPTVHRPVRPSSTKAVRVGILLAGAGGGGDGFSPTKKR